MVRSFKYLTILLLLTLVSSAANGQIRLSIHDTTATTGNFLTVPVFVDSSLTGKGASSYQIQLSYSSYYMIADSVIAAGSMSQSLGSLSFNKSTPGIVTIACAGTTPLSGTGILVYVRFKLLTSGGVSLTFSGGTASNYFNEGSPSMIFRNGSISILAQPSISISPTGGLLTVGDQVKFTAYSGTAPYHWSLTNSAVATIDSTGLLTATHAGFTKVVAVDSVGTVDTTSGQVEVRAFRLTVNDTSYVQGQTFSLPVYTSDLTGLNVTSGSFQVNFNPNLLSPIGFTQAGTMMASYPDGALGNSGSGVLSFSFAGTSPLSGQGVLVYLQFKVSRTNTGSTGLVPANIVFNQNLQGDSATANFRTINLSTLAILPKTANLMVGDTLRLAASGGNPPYTWSTSDSTRATIDQTGLLTARKGGAITVQAVDSYGGSGASGTIQIYDTRVSVADTVGMIGDTVDVPLYVFPMTSGMMVLSCQGTVSFDTSVVHPIGIVGTGSLTNGWTYTFNISGTQVIFAGAGTTSLNAPGILCKLRFFVPAYVSSGRVSNLTLQQFLLNEGSPRAMLVNGAVKATPVSLPAAPSNLAATTVNYGRIDLNWTDNSNNESSFGIQRTIDTTSWSTVANLPANTTSDSDSGLVDGSMYFYRVYASNLGGNSGYSNMSSAVTPMKPPTNLTATQVVGGNVKLTWNDNSGSELGYYIERKTGASGTYAVTDSVGTNTALFTDTTGVPGNVYFYRVRGHNLVVMSAYSNEVSLTLLGVKSDQNSVPTAFGLAQNFPNPFNPATTIEYDVPSASHVTLVIYDILGRSVVTLVDADRQPGSYQAVFNAAMLPSGLYFYRLQAGGFTDVKKMTLMK